MSDFSVSFQRSAFEELDQFALLARQDYNLGAASDWFGDFRGGLYGFYARLRGVVQHYQLVHAWLPIKRFPTEVEYQLATTIFSMDSALECLVFALNALGYAVSPQDFRDITDSKELRRIGPDDILGAPDRNPPLMSRPGYSRFFPRLQDLFRQEEGIINRVCELHDVSKHRRTIFIGGMCRRDPPPGFFESLGMANDSGSQTAFSPMAEIILKCNPKTPSVLRKPTDVDRTDLLEKLVPAFVTLVNRAGEIAVADARNTIPLKERSFLIQ